MRRTVGGVLAVLALLPAARALDDPKPAGTPAEQYKALVKEYQGASAAAMKAMREAKTNEDRQKALKERPSPEKFAPRFLALAEKHPKDPAAVDALAWVVNNSSPFAKGGPRAKALAVLVRDHLKSDKLAPVCNALSRTYDEASREALRAILDKNPHTDVKAAACMALGTAYENAANLAGRLDDAAMAKQVEQVLGKDVLEDLKKQGEEALNKKAAALFERVVKEFPDARDARGNRMGTVAEGKLLGPGRAAPEIEGEDTDGKKFKLSDYRGKVVLLDFWGNW
jgi:hypothetical protein